MKPEFDENGLAIKSGSIRCFYFNSATGEYTGWSDEYINTGVSMPGNSTDIDPGEEVDGKVAVFSGGGWSHEPDHRGDVVYSTTDGSTSTVNYIGDIKTGYTTIAPSTPYDKWDGTQWVTDASTQHAAAVVSAEAQKLQLIDQANAYMNSKQWPGKAAMGRLNDTDKAQYNLWLDYLDALEAVKTTSAPDINWPTPPAAV
ncbi:tail fiber assembly protein [Escherichia coli]|uniref:tail fiber assembly protein n=1 Tax=Escherichia coli TaxID=562 RepID=UPI0015E5FC91|nr:tail fiber assembly protein [Escherichia coli]MBA1671310.1 tail fiber assembly protein [Escherichia coli]NYZ42415.1 tail fiber assembly protein [Escherichia coli]